MYPRYPIIKTTLIAMPVTARNPAKYSGNLIFPKPGGIVPESMADGIIACATTKETPPVAANSRLSQRSLIALPPSPHCSGVRGTSSILCSSSRLSSVHGARKNGAQHMLRGISPRVATIVKSIICQLGCQEDFFVIPCPSPGPLRTAEKTEYFATRSRKK